MSLPESEKLLPACEIVLPACETLLLAVEKGCLHITLNRPQNRNAMSLQMVRELMDVFEAIQGDKLIQSDKAIRAVVLRGAEGHFCAGGDIRDMANARAGVGKTEGDPFQTLNREFGRMITAVNRAPQTVIAVLEGAVLGGGFGLACVSDVALAHQDARFGLPETGLGIPPAQIAPFVVRRIGLTQARRLALLGARFNGEEALRLGLVHECVATPEALDASLAQVLAQVRRCAPGANTVTKALLLAAADIGSYSELDTLLDAAAVQFAQAVQGKEGQEGTMAFMQKRDPSWAQ
jgi:isohexenylglutaconyl-CoA hydratase